MKSSKVNAAIDDYLESVLLREKEQHRSELQPFSHKEAKIRDEISRDLHDFQSCYANGYQAILEVLKKNKAVDVSLFVVDAKKLSLFEDLDALIELLQQGQPLYEILGFTEVAIEHFYTAACTLKEKKELEKAKDAFYFLVTIASHIYELWLALGQVYADLRRYDAALDTFIHAIDIDPTQKEGYLGAVHALIEVRDFEQAEKVCEKGIQYAQSMKLDELEKVLEEGKRVVATLFVESQELNYPS